MGEKSHILIVEDSETQALRLQMLLEAEGWTVTHTASGEQALTLLNEVHPDVLIVDFYLPEMLGDELCRRVRANPTMRDLPILMLTSDETDSTEMLGLENGADSYVSKSEDANFFLMKLRTLIRNSRRSSSNPKRGRILAIDDSPTYLAYLTQVLETGYDVVTADCGLDGLKLVRSRNFDCVLVDLMMPDMGGTEVCRHITAMRTATENPVVVLMLTSSESKEDMTSGLEAGADDFVAKGSDVAVLRARIQALLRRKFLQDENQRGIEELKNRELRQKNKELAAALAAARDATEMKSRFLARMSHELRTPLNAIIGFSELLHDEKVGPLNEQQVDFLADVLASSRHLLELINDVLDIAKIEAGKMEFHPGPVDLVDLVAEVTGVLRPVALEKKIQMVTFIDPKSRFVTLDPGKLKQVLYNYLSNALKFTPNQGHVRVDIRPASEGLFCLEVEDTGVGIAPAQLERLFTEFEAIDSGLPQKQRGSGLGLAITRHIIEAQGGRVAVRSMVGKGSVFSAVLPFVVHLESSAKAQIVE